jgi:hypothetical protein
MLLLKQSERRASQQICQQERKNNNKKTAPAQNPKTAPLSKTTKLPGHNKSPNSAFPAPPLYYSKNHSSSYNRRNRRNEIEKTYSEIYFFAMSAPLASLFLLKIISHQKNQRQRSNTRKIHDQIPLQNTHDRQLCSEFCSALSTACGASEG